MRGAGLATDPRNYHKTRRKWSESTCRPKPSSTQANYPLRGLRFIVSDCSTIPFPENSFDLIVAFEIIEHLTDFRAFLQECARVITPQGLFVGSSPNKTVLRRVARRGRTESVSPARIESGRVRSGTESRLFKRAAAVAESRGIIRLSSLVEFLAGGSANRRRRWSGKRGAFPDRQVFAWRPAGGAIVRLRSKGCESAARTGAAPQRACRLREAARDRRVHSRRTDTVGAGS